MVLQQGIRGGMLWFPQSPFSNSLKQLNFKVSGWGRTEANELPHILMPDEEIYELVNGVI